MAADELRRIIEDNINEISVMDRFKYPDVLGGRLRI